MATLTAVGTCAVLDRDRMMRWSMGQSDTAPLEAAMARFASGHDAALGEVYDLASAPVFRFLMRLCRDQALAEDLTQETFLRIHRARGLYREGAAVLPWAYTIARRLFLDAVRARKVDVSRPAPSPGGGAADPDADAVAALPAHAPTAEELLADRQLAAAVDEALTRIPEGQATAFRLLKAEGLSVAEAAVVMGSTPGSVKLRAHRAYEALRGLLAGRFGPPAASADPGRTMGKKLGEKTGQGAP